MITRRGLFGLVAGAVAAAVSPKPKWEWRSWYARVDPTPNQRIYFSEVSEPDRWGFEDVLLVAGAPICVGDLVTTAPMHVPESACVVPFTTEGILRGVAMESAEPDRLVRVRLT